MMSTKPDWSFSQCFGERVPAEELSDPDILSAVEFDRTGSYLATGDKGGRVVVFQKDGEEIASSDNKNNRQLNNYMDSDQERTPNELKNKIKSPRTVSYQFHCEFQSHEPEFDYLKSLEIEEKINKIRWCRPSNNSLFLLSTNDKTIKLWKVYEKQMKIVKEMNVEHKSNTLDGHMAPNFDTNRYIRIPKLECLDTQIASMPRRTFANAHAYHINSISVNSDGETYLSADDLRINLWNLDISNQSYNIVDIKPANMEELTEVITASEFHPKHCNIFMYSSSRGSIKLGDMRDRALCDKHSKMFQEEEVPANKSFFSEIIASISDIKFSNDGRYIVSRDYLTLKVWDVNMESRPVKTIQIHEHLRSKLCDLYENDAIFDKFECCVSGGGDYMMTGSYNNLFHIYDCEGKTDVCMEASSLAPRSRGPAQIDTPSNRMNAANSANIPDTLDHDNKVLHLAWHPEEDTVAIAGANNLFLYSK